MMYKAIFFVAVLGLVICPGSILMAERHHFYTDEMMIRIEELRTRLETCSEVEEVFTSDETEIYLLTEFSQELQEREDAKVKVLFSDSSAENQTEREIKNSFSEYIDRISNQRLQQRATREERYEDLRRRIRKSAVLKEQAENKIDEIFASAR